MKKPINKLAKDIQKFEKALRKSRSDASKEAAVITVGLLANATPVDTTSAISNWKASVGFPTSVQKEPYYPGVGGETKASSVAATIAASKRAVANKKVGQRVFITNNAEHIEKLADGGSTQQPSAGWIEAVGNISERNWKFKYPVLGK